MSKIAGDFTFEGVDFGGLADPHPELLQEADLSGGDPFEDADLLWFESTLEPDPIVQLASEGAGLMDMTPVLGTEYTLSDLDWLGSTQLYSKVEPTSSNDIKPELALDWSPPENTAWGYDLEAREEKPPKLDKAAASDMVASLTRRLTLGYPAEEALSGAYREAGLNADSMGRYFEAASRNRGLLGNIYIPLSAFPGWGSGKWASEIKKRCKGARYLLADRDVSGEIWAEGGRCAHTGLKIVPAIPWDAALKHYRPKMADLGYQFDDRLPSRRQLQQALIAGPAKQASLSPFFPVQPDPVGDLSMADAVAELTAASSEERILSPEPRRLAAAVARVESQHNSWVSRGLITAQQLREVRATEINPLVQTQLLAAIIRKGQKGTYALEGGTVHDQVVREAAAAERLVARSQEEAEVTALQAAQLALSQDLGAVSRKRAAESLKGMLGRQIVSRQQLREWGKESQDVRFLLKKACAHALTVQRAKHANPLNNRAADAALHNARADRSLAAASESTRSVQVAARDRSVALVKTAAEAVAQQVERGLRGEPLRVFVSKQVPPKYLAALVKEVGPLLRKTSALSEPVKETKQYDKRVYRAHVPEQRQATALWGEVQKAVRWARQKMAEGFAGRDLDAIIAGRIAPEVLEAAAPEIAELRKAHEGGSGHFYVDAEHYASKTGAEGCKVGAKKNATNPIPVVAAMSRCAQCVHAHKTPDGQTKCSVYNKILARIVDNEQHRAHRAANIKAANATDYERTASLFANTYDHSEFGLHSMEVGELLEDDPVYGESKQLDQILFDDWVV